MKKTATNNFPNHIEKVKIKDLKPYENNARTHSEEQVERLAASIKEYSFTNPLLIDEGNTILAGHARYEAARILEMTEVPCIRLSHLTDVQKRAYVLADNRIALDAGWDDEMLNKELAELLEADGFDVSLTGFTEDEIEERLKGNLAAALELDEENAESGAEKEEKEYRCPECGCMFKLQE